MVQLPRPRGVTTARAVLCSFCIAFILRMMSGSIQLYAVKAFQLTINKRVAIKSSPLIGGPSWLPVHCKVVVNDSYLFDFVPLNADSMETIKKLMTLQPVPATVRVVQKSRKRETDESSEPSDGEDDELTKLYEERAVQFCQKYDEDLHLIKNNCWSFAFDLLRNVSLPER
mmetsp:Transcript_15411/g.31606  ORF Transcript_15411/g.31606 Transcript_15411/m.31606 type:complete len:171 (-) Transcript_15411:1203-1715(-)